MDLSRRRFLFCAPAIITPGVLMTINPFLGVDLPDQVSFFPTLNGVSCCLKYGDDLRRTRLSLLDVPRSFLKARTIIAMTGRAALKKGVILPPRMLTHIIMPYARDLDPQDGHTVPIVNEWPLADRPFAPAMYLPRGPGDLIDFEDEIVSS